MLKNCEAKAFYDTEWGAQRAAAFHGHKYNTVYDYYPCGNHWHLTHNDPKERGKYLSKTYCSVCQRRVGSQNMTDHLAGKAHQKRLTAGGGAGEPQTGSTAPQSAG